MFRKRKPNPIDLVIDIAIDEAVKSRNMSYVAEKLKGLRRARRYQRFGKLGLVMSVADVAIHYKKDGKRK